MSINKSNMRKANTRGIITEWDIQSANTSLMRYYRLLDEETIVKIEKLPKRERVVVIGKLMLKDKELSVKLEKAFTDIIQEFCDANKIDVSNDVISIKKDAIYIVDRDIKVSKFGDNVVFIPKNIYSHVFLLPRYEFYYNSTRIDVKGISDEVIPFHKDGILQLIELLATCKDSSEMHKIMKEMCSNYKKRLLRIDFYREFSSESTYKLSIGTDTLSISDISEDELDSVNILYNYQHIILELVKLLIG